MEKGLVFGRFGVKKGQSPQTLRNYFADNSRKNSSFCKALKQNIPDEFHDKAKYEEMAEKYPHFKALFKMLSNEENNHGHIQEWLYKENCE